MAKHIVIIPGDDAAPEAMTPTVDILKSFNLDIVLTEFPSGEEAIRKFGTRKEFDRVLQTAIDDSDSTLFGSTNGTTGGIGYLRWGRQTFANVRPARWRKGFQSPLKTPEAIDFVIVRENLEDLYMGVEGELSELAPLSLMSSITRERLDTDEKGLFAIKAITESGCERIARFAFELAGKRQRKRGTKGLVTCTSKYNMLRKSDGLFRQIAEKTSKEYPRIGYEEYIVDDFARRLVASPDQFDVVVMPNLYGDILSDVAAGTIGGLGLAPSGCYGDDYAYFESVHGSAPDIAGQNIINPTATLLSAALLLEYIGYPGEAQQLEDAIARLYAEGKYLPRDQGGETGTKDFCAEVHRLIFK